MYRITTKKLRQSHFCEEHILRFKKVFPGGAPFSLATLQKAQENFLDVGHVFDRACDRLWDDYFMKSSDYYLPRKVEKKLDSLRDQIYSWYVPPDYELDAMTTKQRARVKAAAKRDLAKFWGKKELRDRVRGLIAVKVKEPKSAKEKERRKPQRPRLEK